MSVDVYSSCPCGSGKKLKFCCHDIVGEMEKIQKLRDSDQSRTALQQLEKLAETHFDNAWIATTRALILLDDGRHAEAKQVLQPAMQAHPQNDLVLALYALTSLATDGYESSRPVVHRAFQKCAASFPDLVGGIAISVSQYMLATRRYMAARQHLALAMRFASEKNRQDVFVRLLQFDGDRSIPYPLRSVHHLAEYKGTDERNKEFAKGAALCMVGCWGPASRMFARIAEEDAESAALWQNIGLCRAWDGDQIGSADALHRAAKLHQDFETAVECETVAQVLDLSQTTDRVATLPVEYKVKSVSRLLTKLDAEARMPRQELSPEEFENMLGLGMQPVGLFDVIDKELSQEPIPNSTRPDELASVLAQVVLFDADPETETDARAVLTRFEIAETEAGQQLFESVAGDEVELVPSGEEEYVLPGHWTPREFLPLERRWHIPHQTPVRVRRSLEGRKWDQFINETWLTSSLGGLHGKTPLEAAADPEYKLLLTAALYVLDAYGATGGFSLDFKGMCERLKLDPPRPIEVKADLPLNSFSPMQLQRLPLKPLSDAQMNVVLNRALLIHHPVFLHDVLNEALSRPACKEKINLPRAYWTLAELCRAQGRYDEAFSWISKGYEAIEETADRDSLFEAKFEWTMRELSIRTEDPDDPGLAALLRHLWEYYVPKLPRLAEHLTSMLSAAGIKPPLEAGVAAEVGYGSTTASGVWTPEASSGRGSEKKLWLPGQE